MLKTTICFLLLLCACTCAVQKEQPNDRYHPSSKQFKSYAAGKAPKGPWDQTDWNALARGELQNAVNIADNLNKNKAKNVILFVGDGMGISTLSAARLYNSENRNLQKTDIYLPWEKFPHVGLSRTYNVDRSTPDSAATSTAYLCGVKANYETIGVNDQVPFDSCSAIAGNTVRSIAKHSVAANKWTGVVTTTRITHASPAGFYAHVANRDWEAYVPTDVPNFDQCDDIAKQLITDPENQKTRVILGGGLRMFLPNNETGLGSSGARTDGRNLINEWIQTRTDNGESYKHVQNKTQFDAVDVTSTDYLFGLFDADHMDYEADRIKVNPPQQPSLAEMTEKAIGLLSRSPNGYFLFVEEDPDFRQDTGIWITSETHGGEDVGIFARGPLSHLIHGNHEQNYISHMMMYASCVGNYITERHCTTGAKNSAL